MSYSVEHIRFTLECDVCGLVENRDLDAVDSTQGKGIQGWGRIDADAATYFCCPGCAELVKAILERRPREKEAARRAQEAACEHDYSSSGLLEKCTKCQRYR